MKSYLDSVLWIVAVGFFFVVAGSCDSTQQKTSTAKTQKARTFEERLSANISTPVIHATVGIEEVMIQCGTFQGPAALHNALLGAALFVGQMNKENQIRAKNLRMNAHVYNAPENDEYTWTMPVESCIEASSLTSDYQRRRLVFSRDTLKVRRSGIWREVETNDVGLTEMRSAAKSVNSVSSRQANQSAPFPSKSQDSPLRVLAYRIAATENVSYPGTLRMVYRVVVQSEKIPREQDLRETALAIWQKGKGDWAEFTVFMYLPSMDTRHLAYAVGEFRPSGLLEFRVQKFALVGTRWE